MNYQWKILQVRDALANLVANVNLMNRKLNLTKN